MSERAPVERDPGRLMREVQAQRAAVQAAQESADKLKTAATWVGKGMQSANTGDIRKDYAIGFMGAAIEKYAPAIGVVLSGQKEAELRLSQAQGAYDFETRKR